MISLSASARQPHRQPWSLEHFLLERSIAMGHAIDRRTHLSYNSHVQSYLQFCKIHDFSLQPTIDRLSFYIVFMSHHIKPDSVCSYLSGICHRLDPIYPDIRQIQKSYVVQRTLQGCARLYNSPRKQKDPLAVEDLLTLLDMFPPSSHDNCLFVTILLTAFQALHRLGELTIPDDPRLLDSRKIIQRISVNVLTIGYSYILPRHKPDRTFTGAKVIVATRTDSLNPLPHFLRYLKSRDSLFPYHPQLFLTTAGKPPTRAWFLSRLQRLSTPNIAGHSLRAGGTTFYAVAGYPDDHIQALGRWSSEAFHAYIRKNPTVLHALLHSDHNHHPNL